jgi:DNA-binding NarL/FixJ family response regulator
MSNLKILIADDHDLVRKGLRMLIEEHPGWTVCAEARSGAKRSTRRRSTLLTSS